LRDDLGHERSGLSRVPSIVRIAFDDAIHHSNGVTPRDRDCRRVCPRVTDVQQVTRSTEQLENVF
jgi:hypothetical protein